MENTLKLPEVKIDSDNPHEFQLRVPKRVAVIKVCGAITLYIDDTMDFIMPTEEQRKNLKEMLCIEVIPVVDQGGI
jgi:hypothetical protein